MHINVGTYLPEMNPNKYENVMNLNNQDRYSYLIRKVADFEKIYLIYSDASSMFQISVLDMECIPLFPEQEFAEMLLDKWVDAKMVKELSLYKFLDWIKKDSHGQLKFAVFPNDAVDATIQNSVFLYNDLIEECQQYE